VREVSQIQTRRAAEERERQIRLEFLAGTYGKKQEVKPTFSEWFHGRFWTEWVIARKNKPSSIEEKRSIFRIYLDPVFGKMPRDKIGVGEIAAFRASLVTKGLSEKSINNILTVVSKPLRDAVDVEVIPRAPKVGLFKVEQPEIEFLEFEHYSRILAAAAKEGPLPYSAVCLAGEAGLRVGEVKALRWREDVDMVARTVTVNRQMRRGIIGSPKGRTRRTVPMMETLW
jgi:integrase